MAEHTIDPRINLESVAVHGRIAIRAIREAASVAWDNRESALTREFNEVAHRLEDAMMLFERRRDDVEIKRILAMSDEEILADCRARGEDPAQVAEHCRAVLQRAAAHVRKLAAPVTASGGEG